MSLISWAIDPLPDFLSDHTLTGQTPAERLREYAARWVQFAGSLWEWHDEATLALRYVARNGRISIFLLARPHEDNPKKQARLEKELGVVLRAHRLLEGSESSVLPEAKFRDLSSLGKVVIAEVRQLETREFWSGSTNLLNQVKRDVTVKDLPAEEWTKPRVIFPWWGPGGPFLLPMESLISQRVGCSLTAYVSPTTLDPAEAAWLAFMSREAASKAEQNSEAYGAGAPRREVDPSARLAGRLYMANLRRLSATPFLVTVHCAASAELPPEVKNLSPQEQQEKAREQLQLARDVTLSLAGAVQSLVHEPAFERPQQEDDRLPSGATVLLPKQGPEGDGERERLLSQYNQLSFVKPTKDNPLARIGFLADPQGAATVFRLPVSVRGGVPGVQVRQLSPTFHPGPRVDHCPEEQIELGEYHSGGKACVPIKDLAKHALITGFTGSGKTVTVLQILHQLWLHKVPFLVIESAKQEYRGFLGVPAMKEDLRIFTLGNETCVPFRLNPFELLPGVRVEAHLGKLQSCFEGAIPQLGPSSSVINEALEEVYRDCGWAVTDSYPEKEGQTGRIFPTLNAFVEKVKLVIKKRGYTGELLDNLTAAIVGRISPLLRGSKGLMFETQRCLPSPEVLFTKPVILEMNDLVIDDKALLTMFLLSLLREYRELHRTPDGRLLHVTMVEEAHNILEEVGSTGGGDQGTQSDSRYKAVQAFCGLLTEIRSLGEGLIIADQSPVKLARDAMRNTNLQIAHQLRDANDRKAVANAMIMENEQRDFLGKLHPGHAAVFRTGLEKATFLKVHEYTRRDGLGFKSVVADTEVRQHMEEVMPQIKETRRTLRTYKECDLCEPRDACPYQEECLQIAETDGEAMKEFKVWWDFRQEKQGDLAHWQETWLRATAISRTALNRNRTGSETEPKAFKAWCCFIHLWHRYVRLHNKEVPDLVKDNLSFFQEQFNGQVKHQL